MPIQGRNRSGNVQGYAQGSGGGGGGGSAGWVTRLEIDWTTQSAVDIKALGDGAHTVAGVPLIQIGSADCASCAVVPGTGLVTTLAGGLYSLDIHVGALALPGWTAETQMEVAIFYRSGSGGNLAFTAAYSADGTVTGYSGFVQEQVASPDYGLGGYQVGYYFPNAGTYPFMVALQINPVGTTVFRGTDYTNLVMLGGIAPTGWYASSALAAPWGATGPAVNLFANRAAGTSDMVIETTRVRQLVIT